MSNIFDAYKYWYDNYECYAYWLIILSIFISVINITDHV